MLKKAFALPPESLPADSSRDAERDMLTLSMSLEMEVKKVAPPKPWLGPVPPVAWSVRLSDEAVVAMVAVLENW